MSFKRRRQKKTIGDSLLVTFTGIAILAIAFVVLYALYYSVEP